MGVRGRVRVVVAATAGGGGGVAVEGRRYWWIWNGLNIHQEPIPHRACTVLCKQGVATGIHDPLPCESIVAKYARTHTCTEQTDREGGVGRERERARTITCMGEE